MSTQKPVFSKVEADGSFKPKPSDFREFVSKKPGAKYPPEKGRYHLYVSLACPWAHRTLIVRKLKGLEDVISVDVVDWLMGENGWRFNTNNRQVEGADRDTVNGAEYIREIYYQTAPNYTGRFTVPALYDKKTHTIVNNESSEIIRMFYTEFDDFIPEKFRTNDFYPEKYQKEIDEINEWIFDGINTGVYKAGFASAQEAYDKAVVHLFKSLDRAEEHLKQISELNQDPTKPIYLIGNELTEADIRLYPTIIRFDVVYVQHFKCNIRDIRHGYPFLHKWLRQLYWDIPAFYETTDFDNIKWHYTKSQTQYNPTAVTPAGPLPHILPKDE